MFTLIAGTCFTAQCGAPSVRANENIFGPVPDVAGALSGAQNTRFTRAEYAAASRRWQQGMGNTNILLDPTLAKELYIRGGYHVERGLRGFKEWAAEMTSHFGQDVRPHLPGIYE